MPKRNPPKTRPSLRSRAARAAPKAPTKVAPTRNRLGPVAKLVEQVALRKLGDGQSTPMPVRFAEADLQDLKRLSSNTGVPMQEIVRRALRQFLDDNPHSVPPREYA